MTSRRTETEITLLKAAEACLLRHGLAGLSTRKIADEAGMPLSQIHYHLGTKHELLLALFEFQNEKLLARQQAMYAGAQPLWKRWMQACDYLDEDLASGYVRVLQEMIAAGWSDPRVAQKLRKSLHGWFALLTQVASDAATELGGFGALEPEEAAVLAGGVFLGVEAMILLGFTEKELPSRRALRRIGDLLRTLESRQKGGKRNAGKRS